MLLAACRSAHAADDFAFGMRADADVPLRFAGRRPMSPNAPAAVSELAEQAARERRSIVSVWEGNTGSSIRTPVSGSSTRSGSPSSSAARYPVPGRPQISQMTQIS